MKIKFWGVRGSLPSTIQPVHLKARLRGIIHAFLKEGYTRIDQIDSFLNSQPLADLGGYGSATTCVQIVEDSPQAQKDTARSIIIDGGSGIKFLSDELAKQVRMKKEHHILMTHFHYDHIIGLCFFFPHFLKGHKIHYYSIQPECESIVRGLFSKPVFPIPYDELKAEIIFHKLDPYTQYDIEGFNVTAYQMDHPDPCYGYRVEKNGRTYAHAVDNEADRLTREELGKDAGLFEGAELLFIDAQYEESEMIAKKGWGHGTFDRTFELCETFKIKRAFMAHHDPSSSDEAISHLERKARRRFEEKYAHLELKWSFAVEGHEETL